MNCEEFEKRVLLEQSGELDEKDCLLLQAHREQCSRCRTYGEESGGMLEMTRASLPGEPGVDALDRIRTMAADRARSPVLFFYRPAVRALACAAALLVVVGGWWLIAPRAGAARVRDMNVIVTVMMDEDTIAERSDTAAEATDLQALAEMLLRIEESAVEGTTDQEELLWPLDSRAPRWRSSSEALPRRYG